MCTVIFTPRRHGYVLGMNRDEKRTRSVGLPPQRGVAGGRHVLFPSEPSGGTWVGVNDVGITFALINWYSVPASVEGKATSRGWVIRDLLAHDTLSTTTAGVEALSLDRVNPFRLIVAFPGERQVVEWRWNLRELTTHVGPWESQIWSSSGFDEAGAQKTRGAVFHQARLLSTAGRIDWIRRMHRSHAEGPGPYSICMHRDDAETVSCSEITVTHRVARLRYSPGSPCCTPFLPPERLVLRQSPALSSSL